MKYLIFGGTGSLGTVLAKRLLEEGQDVFVFARGEEKHFNIKLKFPKINNIIGDIRDYDKVFSTIKKISPDVIIHASAMKHITLCEEFPEEAVKTNIGGTKNLVKALEKIPSTDKRIRCLSISTDKATSPENLYGMTKAVQERLFIKAQERTGHIHNVCRYGNVLESSGSVIPLFKQKIRNNESINVTHEDMTRFFMSLDEAVDLIFSSLEDTEGMKIFIPLVKSAKILDLAHVLSDALGSKRAIGSFTGTRPGEKMHELLISDAETHRSQIIRKKSIVVLQDIFSKNQIKDQLFKAYSSGDPDNLMSYFELKKFLQEKGII